MLSFHVLGVPWSHPQADHSFQTCLVIKQVIHSVFIFKQGEGSLLAHSCAIFLFYLGGEIYHLVGQLTRSLQAIAQGLHSSIKQLQKTAKFIEQTITEVSTSRIAPPRVVAKRCHTNFIQLLPLVIPLTPERHQGLGWH